MRYNPKATNYHPIYTSNLSSSLEALTSRLNGLASEFSNEMNLCIVGFLNELSTFLVNKKFVEFLDKMVDLIDSRTQELDIEDNPIYKNISKLVDALTDALVSAVFGKNESKRTIEDALQLILTEQNTSIAFMFSKEDADLTAITKKEELGSGTYANVYKLKSANGLTVGVIKQAKSFLDNIERSRRRVDSLNAENKFMLSCELSHPNIIQLLGFGDGFLFLDYCEHGSLEDFMAKNPKQNDSIIHTWLMGISLGIQYLHSMNFVHADFKTGNVLIDSNYQAKLSDFGFSFRIPKNGIILPKGIGSPLYSPPECYKDPMVSQVLYTKLFDIWALGIVFVSVLVWKEYRNFNYFKQIKNVEEMVCRFSTAYKLGVFPRPLNDPIAKTIPDAYQTLVKGMLEIDPGKRTDINAVLSHSVFKNNEGASEISPNGSPKIDPKAEQKSGQDVNPIAEAAATVIAPAPC